MEDDKDGGRHGRRPKMLTWDKMSSEAYVFMRIHSLTKLVFMGPALNLAVERARGQVTVNHSGAH